MKNTISKVVRFNEVNYRILIYMVVDVAEYLDNYLTKETRARIDRLRLLGYCNEPLKDFSPAKAIETLPLFQSLYWCIFNKSMVNKAYDINVYLNYIYDLLNTNF